MSKQNSSMFWLILVKKKERDKKKNPGMMWVSLREYGVIKKKKLERKIKNSEYLVNESR